MNRWVGRVRVSRCVCSSVQRELVSSTSSSETDSRDSEYRCICREERKEYNVYVHVHNIIHIVQTGMCTLFLALLHNNKCKNHSIE